MGQRKSETVKTVEGLLDGIEYSIVNDFQDVQSVSVSKVTSDSRVCEGGYIFTAIPGTVADGHDFIERAVEAGAGLVIVQAGCGERGLYETLQVPVLEVADSRAAYSAICANMYGNAAEQMTLVGITGTNGKTTITYLLEEVLIGMGHAVGVIGTVDYRWFGTDCRKYSKPASRTTPDALELQSILRQMADVGVEYVFMEASSHALDQHRLSTMEFQVAAFTNLSLDHLDYHSDFEDYFRAKSLLFSDHLVEGGKAVINVQQGEMEGSNWGERMAEECEILTIPTITCGRENSADLRLLEETFDLGGSRCELEYEGERFELGSPLVGRFNIENLLTTLSITLALGLDRNEVLPRLGLAGGAPGRMQRVVIPEQFRVDCPEVFVDYAHTPDALAKVLETLKELPHRDLYCVFGCGGDRDNSKRAVMGGIAAELSTVAVVTSDNPRSETPEKILEQVVAGVVEKQVELNEVDWLLTREPCEKGGVVITERSEAIRAAVSSGGAGDIVLIAGKGHEKYQITNDGERFFDDCLEAQEAMIAWNGDHVERALGGKIEGKVTRWWSGKVETDSRKVDAGDIFVALEGEKFDGHEYVDKAREQGAALAVISSKEKAGSAIAQIMVDDTLDGLGKLARYRRSLVKGISKTKMVGITGSCGKTTVKEMVASIFQCNFPKSSKTPVGRVLKTHGNFNNLIGVPLSVFPLSLKHEVAVLELGMNRKGEIDALTRIVEPDISCITNVHAAHLEELKNIEGVAGAKRELFDNTSPEGILVINLDDPLLKPCLDYYPHRKVTFSRDGGEHSDVTCNAIQQQKNGNISFCLAANGDENWVKLSIAGEHSVDNALAAAAIGIAAGVDFSTIVQGLESFIPVDKRMAVVELSSGLNLINDCYNANPASMLAGIKTLSSMDAPNKIAIIGDMLELGGAREDAHYRIGEKTADLNINYLAIYGDSSQFVLKGATDAGMNPDCVKAFDDKSELAAWFSSLVNEGKLQKGDWALLKGSRGMKMETIIEELEANS